MNTSNDAPCILPNGNMPVLNEVIHLQLNQRFEVGVFLQSLDKKGTSKKEVPYLFTIILR